MFKMVGDWEENDSDGEEYEVCCMCQHSMYADGTPLYEIECNHTLHLECLYYWVETKGSKKKCPLCKNKLDRNDIRSQVKEKLPHVITELKQKENNVNMDDIFAELIQQYDTIVKGNNILLNLCSLEWMHLFKKLFSMKGSVKYNGCDYKFKIGTYNVQFFAKNINYKIEDKLNYNENKYNDNNDDYSDYDEDLSLRLTIKVGSKIRKNIKKLEKILKSRFEDKVFDKIILNGKEGNTDSFWAENDYYISSYYKGSELGETQLCSLNSVKSCDKGEGKCNFIININYNDEQGVSCNIIELQTQNFD